MKAPLTATLLAEVARKVLNQWQIVFAVPGDHSKSEALMQELRFAVTAFEHDPSLRSEDSNSSCSHREVSDEGACRTCGDSYEDNTDGGVS